MWGRRFCWRPRYPSWGSGWPSPQRPGDLCSEVRQWNLPKRHRGWPSSRGWPSAWGSSPSISLVTPCAMPWTLSSACCEREGTYARERSEMMCPFLSACLTSHIASVDGSDKKNKRHFCVTAPNLDHSHAFHPARGQCEAAVQVWHYSVLRSQRSGGKMCRGVLSFPLAHVWLGLPE